MLQKLRQTWLSNVRGDVLAGIVVALALIPEAIAFSSSPALIPRSVSTHPFAYVRLSPSSAVVLG